MQQCYIQIKKNIQKQFNTEKGFQIEDFINMVLVFVTCAHTHAHSEWSAWEKGLNKPMGKWEIKKFLLVFIIIGNYVHITYKAIAKSVQGS